MSLNINREVARMKRMQTADLKDYFESTMNVTARSHNRQWMIKKIAWRLQANEEGGLPERVRQRALAMADDADLRIRPTCEFTQQIETADRQTVVPTADTRDPRLPPLGANLTRTYKGQEISVRVRQSDFEFNGETFGTLSAIANRVTGSHVNGFAFFKLGRKEGAAK